MISTEVTQNCLIHYLIKMLKQVVRCILLRCSYTWLICTELRRILFSPVKLIQDVWIYMKTFGLGCMIRTVSIVLSLGSTFKSSFRDICYAHYYFSIYFEEGRKFNDWIIWMSDFTFVHVCWSAVTQLFFSSISIFSQIIRQTTATSEHIWALGCFKRSDTRY